ncbi:MAG TPA: VWA domain-containing protein [Candidatus Sulfotelmatobacter sp.]|nr:VWA domain-containing protein [Candidatus Sulfotelmatobacter sp.]
MRLTLFAAGILVAGLAAFPAVNAVGSGGAAERAQQQQSQPVPQAQQPLNVQVTVVNVFATVRDKRRAIISDLKKEDFKILEDGVEQKVAFFSKELELPITLGMLVDTSGSMTRMLPAEQDAASRFLRQVMRKKDEAMVISFDLDVNLLADFTQDTSVLERAIRRTVINAAGGGVGINQGPISQPNLGGTHLYDAVYLACHDQLVTEAGRKAIILLTDAVDEGSQLSIKDATEAAQRADAVIHVLLLSDPGFYGYGGFGNPGPGAARKMADETGGRVIDVHNEKTLEKAFDEISSELRSQYVLGYYPTNTKRDGTFRKIQVEIPLNSDAKILARKGYYAPKS